MVIEDGRLRVTDIEGARILGEGASAFQTLPWLVREGRVVLGVTSGVRLSRDHRDRRFTLCLDGDGSEIANRIRVGGGYVAECAERAAYRAGVAWSSARTLASGTLAPEGSRIVPANSALPAWPKQGRAKSTAGGGGNVDRPTEGARGGAKTQ